MAREGSEFSGSETVYPPLADGAPSRAMVAAPTYAPPAPLMGSYALPRGPEILYGGFNQTWLAHCLRRRWLMAILMGLLIGAVVAGLLLWLFPETSQVTSYLRVKSQVGSQVFETQSERLMPQEIERQAMNHLALLKSSLVLDAAVLQRDEISELDAVRAHQGEELLWLLSELRVSFPGDGEILEVRYEGDENPEQMAKVVDAIVQAYLDKVLLQDRLKAAATQGDLAIVLESTKKRLQAQLQKLKETQDESGTLQEEVEIPLLRAEITSLESQIVKAKEDLVNVEVFRQMALQSARNPMAVEAVVAAELDKDPAIAMYQQQLFGIQQQLQSAQSTARNQNNTQIRRLQSSLQQTEQQLAQHRASATKQIRDQVAKMPNEALRAAIVEHKIRYEAAAKNLETYEKDLADARTRLQIMGVRDPETEILENNIENETEVAKTLELKVREWQLINEAIQAGKDSDFDKVTVVQKAIDNPLPAVNKVERWSIAGIGGLAAMALTCYGIALIEFRRRRLNTPTDVDEGLGIRVLGVLPSTSLKQLAGNSLVATQVAEAIDNVRATLMHDSTSSPRQVVMVTSSASMEGNTVVASSLALSLSRAGRRTLLVDGDLRSPSLHKLFGMALEDGFSEVLRSEIDLADAVRPTNNEGLYLLTAGVCSAEAIHALATDQPQAVFEKLRDQFDFIVIDAPPVLGISDSLSLGQYVDGAIITVLRDHSEIRKIHKTVELLGGMGVRVIGSVVGGVPIKADRRVVRLHQASVQKTQRLPAKVEG